MRARGQQAVGVGLGRSEDEEQGFLARAAKRGKAHGSEMATLIVSGEEAAYAHFPNAMLLAQFVNKLWRVDHGKSLLGTCGR